MIETITEPRPRPWSMSDDEIKRSWRNCADATQQIKVLAQLNARSRAEVIEKLRSLGIETESTLQRKTKFTPEDDAHIWKMRHDERRPLEHIRNAIGKSTTQTIDTRYKEMLKERIKMRPVIEKAVRAYIKAGQTTQTEARILEAMIKRGI